jgi:hypothetical protein
MDLLRKSIKSQLVPKNTAPAIADRGEADE